MDDNMYVSWPEWFVNIYNTETTNTLNVENIKVNDTIYYRVKSGNDPLCIARVSEIKGNIIKLTSKDNINISFWYPINEVKVYHIDKINK